MSRDHFTAIKRAVQTLFLEDEWRNRARACVLDWYKKNPSELPSGMTAEAATEKTMDDWDSYH